MRARSAGIQRCRWALVGLLALGSGCASRAPGSETAAEAEGWQVLAPGLWHREPQAGVQVLRMDLHEPRLRLRLSAEADKGLPIDARAEALAAVAALNASFFDRSFRPRGFSVSEGRAWAEPLKAQDAPLLACDVAQRCTLQLDPPYALPTATHTAVAGTPWLIRAGQPRRETDDARCAAFCAQGHPRTALGLDRAARHLYLLLAEGRRPERPGLSLARTAALLREAGAWEAFNLDGGGSSALLLKGASRLQRPANEPAHRKVANVLLIEAR